MASALFEIEAGDPSRRSRTVLWTVCALFAVLLLWAIFAKVDIVAVAQGRLVPQTYVKIVQPAEAGIIREILIKDGDSVERGQILVRLDPTVNKADSIAVTKELELERLQLRRIEAELASKVMPRQDDDTEAAFMQVHAQGLSHRQSFLDSLAQETAARERARRELDAAREVRAKLETTLPSYEKTAAAYEKLARENLVGSLQAEERRREASEKAQDLQAQIATVASLEATITEREQRLAQLKSAYHSDLNQQRLQAVTAINRLEQQSGKLTYQEGLLELRAPQSGIVKELATTTVGAVVQPGSVILSLVPANEPLRAEVQIENKDIGFVRPGQAVRIKLTTFQFQKYGMLDGAVETVSADSNSNQEASTRSEPSHFDSQSFKAVIELRNQQLISNGVALPLAAGMQVSAEITQGKRTVLEYLLSPVRRIASEAAKER
jgi:HlyD family secretion protein